MADPQELPRGHAGRRPDLRRRHADRADQEGPGARAGRERGDPAGHPEGQPGHARHPLGLRLLHRRRGRDRPGGGGRDLAGRRRLRHQLRRPAAPDQPRLERRQGPDQAAGGPALPRYPHRRRPERAVPVRQAEADRADGAGGRRTWSSRASGPTATCRSPRPAAGSTAPIPAASAIAPSPRGYDQCGTLGSGNHFLEVQVVDRVHRSRRPPR